MNLIFNESGSKMLGEMLKKLRKSHGYSQAVVADHIGIDRSTYAKYELGRTPDVETIAKLAVFYKISADSILSPFFDNYKTPQTVAALNSGDKETAVYLLSEEEQTLIDYYRNCIRKDVVLDFTQAIFLEDSEDDEN